MAYGWPMSAELTEGEGQDFALPMAKPCGDCSLCCKILRINVLEKPAGSWCHHFAKGQGCSIHASSPAACRSFQCYWTLSDALGDDWRPDRSKLVIWSNVEGRLIVDVDPAFPNAWRLQPYYSQLKAWANRDRPAPMEILVRIKERMLVLFPEGEIDLGPQQTELSISSGYHVEAGRKIPYAQFVEARA
ncbi:MAG TPA: YkgJ family cysteine cluster protein [Caulobacteraceae bacterium]